MPNWCLNQLAVRGPDEDIQRFKAKAVGHCPWSTLKESGDDSPNALNFHSLVPIPKKVLRAGYEDVGYHWEIKNWGVKWGACQTGMVDKCDNCVIYQFDSAWSPPLAFIENVSKA